MGITPGAILRANPPVHDVGVPNCTCCGKTAAEVGGTRVDGKCGVCWGVKTR